MIPGDKRENACDDISDILETSAWESFPRWIPPINSHLDLASTFARDDAEIV